MRRVVLSITIAPVLLTGLLALTQAQIPDEPMDADSTITTGTILGHVYEQDEVTPVTDACVNVSSTAPDWNHVADFCCTDAAGAFTITNVPTGDVYVKTHADCQGAHPNLFDEWYAEGGSTPDGNLATPVEVITGQITSGIVFALDSAGSISGHVFKADGITIITDALISVHAHGITPDSSSLGTWVSQTDGSYTITGLASGAYKVQANNNLALNYVTKYYDDKLTWDKADIIEILAGQVITGIDFTLEEAGTVTGYVYEADGTTPVENACVNVSLTAPDWTHVLGWCCTDENGSYSINGLSVGSYYLRTHADCNGAHPDLIDEWYAEGGGAPDGSQADPIHVLAGQVVTGANFTLDRIANVDLDYVLTIDDPSNGQATVTMTVSNLSTNVFEVEEHGYHGLYINVLALSAHDTNGNLLTVEHLPDSGSTYFDRQADVWRVQCTGLSQILIEYTVQPDGIDYGDRHQGYIAPDFAAMAGEYAFLVPRGSTADSVAVSFNLPIGWLVYTPWTQQEDGYNPALSGTDVIDSLSISSFALGHFDVFTQIVGTTEVAVAVYADWPTVMKEKLTQGSWDVFAYLTSVFGTSVGKYYLLIYCPVAPDGGNISVGEWSNSGGYSIRVKDDGSYWGEWNGLSHQLFHRWNCWSPWGMHGYYGWFVEGPDVLYEMKTVTELRFEWPYGNIMEDPLRWYYDRYLEDYVATGNDRPLSSRDLDDFLIYRKGAMVAFLFAKEIYLRTDGAHTFDNFLQVLVQKYGHHVAPCSEECLKAELAILTGTDFTQFFDDYVYGTTTLPMDWAFEDDDGDGLSNALEVGWDTHPEDEDTDGDGYSDGVEVVAGSDPLDPYSIPPTGHIAKSVTPQGQMNCGDELTYTLVISAPPGVRLGLYDLLADTTFVRFVEQPPGVSYAGGIITGTLTVTPSNRITVSFVTQVNVPGTAGWTVDVTNCACVYPFGGTLGVCTWSNEVTNPAFRPYNVYLPMAQRNH